jgi:hypothetical protein
LGNVPAFFQEVLQLLRTLFTTSCGLLYRLVFLFLNPGRGVSWRRPLWLTGCPWLPGGKGRTGPDQPEDHHQDYRRSDSSEKHGS